MFEIVHWFRTTPHVPRYLFTQNYLRAGSYTLQAIQFTGNDTIYGNFVVLGKRNSPKAKKAKEEYAKHTLHSNVVRFTVVKPRGKELEAWKALAEADRRYASDSDADATIQAYERLVRSFPTSVYAPYAYYTLIFIYSYAPKQNYQKVFELIRRLAEAFPDHPQSLDRVSVYAPLIFREGESELLQRLSQNLPTTKVGRLSKQILQDKETIMDRARGVVTRRKP
jgi:tetratricopeptide (TPR) repeat protein